MSARLRQRSIYATEDRVVLDFGSLYLKCGFSGEPKPRHILPNRIPIPYGAASEGCCSGGRTQPLWGLEVADEQLQALRQILSHLLRELYHRYLLIDAKQRKVVICEGPLFPTSIKQMIADVLFRELEVPSVSLIPASVAALLTVGQTSGLVIDCGNLETSVLPVYDGRALIHNMHALPLAGDSISQRLKVLIKVYGKLLQEGAEEGVPVPDTFINTLTCENWEEMKAQMCFVGERPSTTNPPSETIHQDRRLRAYESSAPQMTWTTNGCDRLVMPGWVRERAAEILFEGDDDMRSVATIVADTLLKCPTDIRTELAQSILLIGGTCMLPGFRQRLLQEIRATLEKAKTYLSIRKLAEMIQCRTSVFAPNCAAWIGGSLIGALKITGEDISRTAFMKSPILPDWAVIQSEPSIGR